MLYVRGVVLAAVLLTVADAKNLHVISSAPGLARDKHSNWVVITTINYPTDTVKRLAKAPGWRVVVVADQKTPRDWQLYNVDILDLEKQKELDYKVLALLPYNHYGRKNLGYLWAIQHGATQVYETDDDNELKLDEPPALSGLSYYVYDASGVEVCNPYAFFGQPQIWPRGYPLEHIKGAPSCTNFTRQPAQPLILQGLADMDPDVDAIYRLTQPLGIAFDSNVPLVVFPHGVMAPFNSQNTLFARDALWGLLIPVTTTFRVCDIWRGYWVQRLLWEIDGNLAFGPPTVNQFRNPHNLLHDMAEEADLYAKAGDLVKLLSSWRGASVKKLPDLIGDLAQIMADSGFWEQDLKAVGYRFPKRQKRRPAEPASVEVARAHTPASWRRYDAIILVVNFNKAYDGMLKVLELLREAYQPIFSRIIFTGGTRPSEFPGEERWVECDGSGGSMMQSCLANVMQEVEAPHGGGYLMLGDDVIISHCQLAAFDPKKVWFQRAVEAKKENLRSFVDDMAALGNGGTWAFSHDQINAVHRVFRRFMTGPLQNRFGKQISQKLGEDLEEAHFGGDNTDVFYIPTHLSADFQLAAAAFAHESMLAEIAIPAILGIITEGPHEFQVFKPLYYWNEARHSVMREPSRFLVQDGLAGRAFMLHPFKLSGADAAKAFWQWWEALSCSDGEPLLDGNWEGTVGVGAGPNGIVDQDENHMYINMYAR
ncbi:hypothetical protein COCSUDRAFT_49414 [Coccomyxa subellipsoidea C-169]|uniref:Nucleotide-diphospho-sugar transferase domain-containing protein n=1 Tax=Coccomyxa subellipsoidea (strain C-169) TaxID=574566 RepID=I0YI92_COCSC|nr:hypothetical protein COCSUDRAFT_49414 [Coccomyxa subellipsoidea C-169]EIE18111.1 hypothetical protein COCSUDRAFT_49414 [Coccomyxa subellipsoidea C-169]|eukprot:XP_005642655.1 hypothetical protein COCSUDRAFT_49414 [Coccomyxa subellipsoidea C-169]